MPAPHSGQPRASAAGASTPPSPPPVPASVPRPLVGPDDAYFWAGIAEGRLLLERCGRCGRIRQPPGPMCPDCGPAPTEVFAPEPRGRVLSWIVPRHPPAAHPAQGIVVLVELTCGARLVLNLRDADPDTPRLDLPVEVFVDTLDGVALPQARPAAVPEGAR